MKRHASALSLVCASVIGVSVLAGCAEGATEIDPAEAYLAATPADAGASTKEDEPESVTLPAPSNPPQDEEDEPTDAGTPPADAGTSGTPDGGGNAGASCASPNACSGAVDLGQVRGDNGADVKTADGHTSQWFKIRVTEDDNAITGLDLWMTATLTSPPGTNFDLYLYVPNSDTLECSAITHQSTSASSTDSATAKFGEDGLWSNGSDDSRTITVEVRHVSGTCDPSKKWTLSLAGNK